MPDTSGQGHDWPSVEYLDRMHRSALEVIEKIGLEVPRSDIREKLAAAGAAVQDGRVKFTAAQVHRFLDKQRPGWGPAAVKALKPPRLVEPLEAYIPLAYQYHLNHETDRIVPITRDHMIQQIKFMHSARQAGVQVRGIPLGCPVGVHPNIVPLLQHLLAFQYAGGGGYTWMWPEETSRYLFRMLEATGELPSESGLYVLSPMKLAGTEFDFAMDHEDMWDTYFIGSHGMTSGNLPAQPMAAFVLSIAETLAASVALWMLSGGKPVQFEIFACPLDMRSMQMLYGGPEFHLFQGIEGRVNSYYNGDANPDTHMFTMAKRPGFQAGSEKAMAATWAALQNSRAIVGAGVLSRDEIFSPEQVLLDWEIVSAANRLRRGVEQEDPAEWFDIIRSGAGGSYATSDHTLDSYYKIYWQPEVFERDTLGSWRKKGEPELRDSLRRRVNEILAAYEYEPPKETLRELQRIYREAEAALT